MVDARIPKSIGVIIDGNRRWAKERELSTLDGHTAGYEKLKEFMRWARDAGVQEVIVYAFSTENWNRAPEEVGTLTGLIRKVFKEGLKDLIQEGVHVRFIGQRERFPEDIQTYMRETEEQTREGSTGTLAIALSYGGRSDILQAVNQIILEDIDTVTEELMNEKLWTAGLAEPDIIIRTGGEKRLSNFLTWQSVYSELFFVDTYWPAFTKEEFNDILAQYAARERRRGR